MRMSCALHSLSAVSVLHAVDQANMTVRYRDATKFPLSMYIKIGFFQCLAMIPGVSRSGATIVGAMLMGADKRSAAEFSFFLAMPTMAGAFAYELLKNYKNLSLDDGILIGIGFVCAFFAALSWSKRSSVTSPAMGSSPSCGGV